VNVDVIAFGSSIVFLRKGEYLIPRLLFGRVRPVQFDEMKQEMSEKIIQNAESPSLGSESMNRSFVLHKDIWFRALLNALV
jgi:hypothetical protein